MASVPVSELTLQACLLFGAVAMASSVWGSIPTVSAVDVVGLPVGVRFRPGVEAGDTLDQARLEAERRRMQQVLHDAGYLRAGVEVEQTSEPGGTRVRFRVEAGEPARVAGWRVAGNDSISTGRVLAALPGVGSLLSQPVLEAAVMRVLRLYELSGFPLVTVVPQSVVEQGTGHVVVLRVEEGEPVVVRFLQFRGAGGLSDRVLSRTARFRSGTRYEPNAVGSWRRNLEQSRLVRVKGDAIVKDERGYGVRFDVTPERASRVAVAAGYVPDPGELSGFAHLGLANLMNTGRRLEVDWRSVPGHTSYFLSYTEPWVLGLWLSLTGSARHETADTVSARTELTGAAVLAVMQELDVRFSTGYDRVAGIDTAGNGETFWVGTGFELDSRDPVIDPARGMHLGLRTRAGTRSGVGGSRFVGRFEGDWTVIGPRFRRLTVANGLHHRVVYSAGHLGESELYRLGGAGSLRGFRQDEFNGTHLGWYDLELRYALGSGSVAYPFFDAGVVEDGGWTMHMGYGLGVRLATRIGMFEIDYGLRAGESPLLGRLHFGYEAGF